MTTVKISLPCILKEHNVYSSYQDNIWQADLADIQLTSKYNKGN